MFKIDDIVITPNDMPGIVTGVLENGMKYMVSEMPKISETELAILKSQDVEYIQAEVNQYTINQLRIPTPEEQERLSGFLQSGATLPSVH